MMYLRVTENEFGFYTDEVHRIEESDVEVLPEDYEEFFKLQSEGVCFKLKKRDKGAKTLFDFVEAYEPKRVSPVLLTKQSLEEEVAELRQAIDTLQEKIDQQ